LGFLGSALIGLRRFLQPDIAGSPFLPRFGLLLAAVKEAGSLSELEAVRVDVDEAVRNLAAKSMQEASEQERTAITAMVVTYINQALAERREAIASEKLAPAASSEMARTAAQ
jgi:hypothetical protein